MKRMLFLIIILYANIPHLHAIDILGYFGYSYSREIQEKNLNFSLGYEILFGGNLYQDFYHFAGLDYKFGRNGNTICLNYVKSPKVNNYIMGFTFGYGTNITYNINKNTFGIGPQIDLLGIIFGIGKINITYRYNIYINSTNSHEIGLRFSIIDLFFNQNY